MGRAEILSRAVEKEGGVFAALTAQGDGLAGPTRAAGDVDTGYLAQQIVKVGRAGQVQRFGIEGRSGARVNEAVEFGVSGLDDDDILGCARAVGLGKAR